MSNHRDHIAGLIDDLLEARRKKIKADCANSALTPHFPQERAKVAERFHEQARAERDQRQALLDAVTTDAEHAAKWRGLVEQLDLDLDDTEVPHVFDAFKQDSQKDDGADEEHAESAPALTVADLEAAPVGSVLGRSSAGGLVEWTKTSDNAAFLREVTRWTPLEAREVSDLTRLPAPPDGYYWEAHVGNLTKDSRPAVTFTLRRDTSHALYRVGDRSTIYLGPLIADRMRRAARRMVRTYARAERRKRDAQAMADQANRVGTQRMEGHDR